MTDRTWIGGGNNNANRANHWSPDGVPQPGDTLEMQAGTMNIRGDDLAGDTLVINKPTTETAPTTLNLSRHAVVSLSESPFLFDSVTVNVKGSDTLNVQTSFGGQFTVNLADHASLSGGFKMAFSSATISGGDGSRYLNNGASVLEGSPVIFDTNVGGNGSFTVQSAQSRAGQLEFGGSVSHGQDVEVAGDSTRGIGSQVKLDHPDAFKGSVGLGVYGEVDLVGLANADSFQLKNDILSIYSGCEVIDQLRLTLPAYSGQDPGLTVRQTAAGVAVARGISNFGTGTLLPEHQPHGWGNVQV